MKRKVLISSAVFALSIFSFNASATLKNTLSIGYAQSSIKVEEGRLHDNPKGFNLKYNREINHGFGLIGSFTYNYKKINFDESEQERYHVDFNYYLLTAGPSYRFNKYINIYGLTGVSGINAKSKNTGDDISYNKLSNSYGLGMQINPIPNLAIDASYEYSKLDDAKIGTWVLGVGYHF